MSDIKSNNRSSAYNVVPIFRSQNSSCALKFFRYTSPHQSEIINLNARNDAIIANSANGTKGSTASQIMIVREDIIKCEVSNDKSGIGGNFSITLKRGRELKTNKNIHYNNLLNPGDWVAIYMKKSNKVSEADLNDTKPSSGFKFLGIIESVKTNEQDNQASGAPYVEIQITGRSFGKAFDSNLVFSPIIAGKLADSILGAKLIEKLPFTDKGVQQSPDYFIKTLTQFFFIGAGANTAQTNKAWYVPSELLKFIKPQSKAKPDGAGFYTILDSTSKVGLHRYSNGVFNGTSSLLGKNFFLSIPSSGTLWAILQFFSNQCLNELFTELTVNSSGKLVPTLVHRQVPFSNKFNQITNAYNRAGAKDLAQGISKTYFVDLPKLEIKSTDIFKKSIGKSDHERINYLSVTPKFIETNITPLYAAALNPPSIKRYGLKSFQALNAYVLDTDKSTDGINSIKQSISLLTDWFFQAHEFYNGTVTIDGVDGFVGVGTNLYIKDVKQLYHIERYKHSYSVDASGKASYITDLELSRGQLFDGKTASFIAENTSKEISDPITVVTSFTPKANFDKGSN